MPSVAALSCTLGACSPLRATCRLPALKQPRYAPNWAQKLAARCADAAELVFEVVLEVVLEALVAAALGVVVACLALGAAGAAEAWCAHIEMRSSMDSTQTAAAQRLCWRMVLPPDYWQPWDMQVLWALWVGVGWGWGLAGGRGG